MHRKTNLQTTVTTLDSTESFQTLFSTQCLPRDNGHHRNSKLRSTFKYPNVMTANYPPVKSKTTHILDNSPILYRTSELITSNLKLENWFHKPINDDRLFTDHQPSTYTDDNQYQHFGLCCAHMVGFITVIILLGQCFGIRIVEKSKHSIDSARTIFEVLVDPVNIDVVFEFAFIDEYVKHHKKRSTKNIRRPSTVIDISDSGWESVGISQQSFRDKSGMKRDEYLKKRKCTSVGPILLEIELPVRSDVKATKSDWNSVEHKLLKRKESDGNSTSGSYTTSYVCVIFIFIYFICSELPPKSVFFNVFCPPIKYSFHILFTSLSKTTIPRQ